MPEEKRLPALKDMRERGLATREVLKQIGAIPDGDRN